MDPSETPATSEYLKYLDAMLRQDDTAASKVVDACLKSGWQPVDIYVGVLSPALSEIGELWSQGRLNIAEEHWATETTMRTLWRVRSAMPIRAPLGVRAVVSSVDGNQHSLGSRMIADLLEMDGWDVDFLGANIPTVDLVAYIQRSAPDLIAMSVSLTEQFGRVREAVATLRQSAPESKILLGGRAFSDLSSDIENDLGADAIAADALNACQLARRLVGLDRRIPLEGYLATIGQHVRRLRIERGWNQRELGDAAELDRAYISSVEHGKQNLTLGAIKRLADALDVSIEALLLHPASPNVAPATLAARPSERESWAPPAQPPAPGSGRERKPK